jgi:hypothetical protein
MVRSALVIKNKKAGNIDLQVRFYKQPKKKIIRCEKQLMGCFALRF